MIFKKMHCHRQWRRNEELKQNPPVRFESHPTSSDHKSKQINELIGAAAINGYDTFKIKNGDFEVLKNGVLHATIKLIEFSDGELLTFVSYFSKKEPFTNGVKS